MGLSNYLPNSRISQSGVCTSSTRPASPYEGQVIYETDTNRVLVYDNSAWVDPSTGKTQRSGLTQIVPTVSGSGVSVNSAGVVTLTAATSAVITGCFPTTFNLFRVFISDFVGSTTAQDLLFQLRGASTVTTNYRSGGRFGTYAGSFGDVSSITNRIAVGSVTSSEKTNFVVDLFNPNLAVITGYSSNGANRDAWVAYGGQNTNTTAYENCEISVASGTLTGKVYFYGYNQ